MGEGGWGMGDGGWGMGGKESAKQKLLVDGMALQHPPRQNRPSVAVAAS